MSARRFLPLRRQVHASAGQSHFRAKTQIPSDSRLSGDYGRAPDAAGPAEILPEQKKVLRKDGTDITEAYRRGAEETLRLAQLFGCKLAVLKERSPSCGKDRIHDGSFSGAMTDGDGITTALLRQNGIEVIGESEISRILLHESS